MKLMFKLVIKIYIINVHFVYQHLSIIYIKRYICIFYNYILYQLRMHRRKFVLCYI